MKIFDRYTQQLVFEKTPCKTVLQLLYCSKLGNFLLRLFIKRAWVSRCIGFLMNSKRSKKKILPFVQKYGINLNAFEKKLEDYIHFNDFFYRKFKPGQRPICPGKNNVCFPAEGRHLGFKNIDEDQHFYVKGQSLSLATLIGNKDVANMFAGGTCVISRLSPLDYHRFHFPCSGVPQKSYCVNGSLLSVHPIALQHSFKILGENKRWVTLLQSKRFGSILMIEVGASCVGSVTQTFTPGVEVMKGDEKGYFSFGGSTVITLFEHGRIELSDDLICCTQHGIELYAHVGDLMGQM